MQVRNTVPNGATRKPVIARQVRQRLCAPLPNKTTISRVAARSAADDVLTADVVIVGGGIVGLLAAQELLNQKLSVALLERKGLCAGATGAGQGYLWMAHRSPGSVGWALAARSMALWRKMLEAEPGLRGPLEWQDCGSLLLSTSAAESAALSERQLALNAVGLRATYLDGGRLAGEERALRLPGAGGGAGLRVDSDTQINGRATAHLLLERCRRQPGFTALVGPEEGQVTRVELAGACSSSGTAGGQEGGGGGAEGGAGHVVLTPRRRIHARRALVLAAGVWSGGLLAAATGQPGWAHLLQPRRGHLLELPRPEHMPPVVHGMMEMSYTKHYATSSTAAPHAASSASASSPSSAVASAPSEAEVDITFTATTSASGSLLIGSSREFSGWDATPSPAIVAAILQRSALFLPHLQPAAEAAAAEAAAAAETAASSTSSSSSSDGAGFQSVVSDSSSSSSSGGGAGPLAGLSVRVGLRPYAVGGLPLVGPVEGAPGLFVAAGHEGSGLCLGPGTAELLSRHIRKHVGGSGVLDTRSFDELLPDVRRRAAAAAAAGGAGGV
ncbi:hypothetical protein Agub_g13730 [Astrephomene gubernaculifera]|uniref:FAD-dependent oxidoreductase domain-containing protein 1 n=1 Tax=Astrephomene gubernaculifera TaxID=47775 RepID=A0AAD3HSF1_9CHLO|nr:hypothetical protein Agub_g13730 [Astrephomene gubernaculifera]